ncbi:TPA: transposase, partial [Staphylococcus pseudintermedius]|nr:transposase [Staphylococcus pseudintermedius]
RLFKSWQSQYSLVQYLLNLDETLKETYETGHRLLSALKANDIQQLRFILQDAKTKDTSKGLKRVIHTFIKYMPYISSTMRHRHLTNGPIEGINNKIKLIKRVSYGYRNFWNFR